MRTTKKIEQKIEKEVKEEVVTFLDRHNLHWFIDSKNNELRLGKSFSDFLNKETENFQIKKIHSCDEKYWKIVETTDEKFVLLSRTKFMK